MNLSAYDKIGVTIRLTKIYNDNKIPYIVTREVKQRKYYCYVKRYNPQLACNVFYLVLLDDKPNDRPVCRTRRDNYGRLKFNLAPIQSWIRDYESITCQKVNSVELTLETEADDGDIYKLNLESFDI